MIADIREAVRQNTIVKPRGLNSCPVIPSRNARGMNTTHVVAVPPRTEAPTTLAPSRASFIYSTRPALFSDAAVALKQLSSTTIELSTIIPTPSVRALMVITLRENPIRSISINAARIETGMELPTIRDALISPKKSHMIIIEITTAMIKVSTTDISDSIMESDESSTIMMFKSGSSATRRLIVFFTWFDNSMAVALCCLLTETEIVSFPS